MGQYQEQAASKADGEERRERNEVTESLTAFRVELVRLQEQVASNVAGARRQEACESTSGHTSQVDCWNDVPPDSSDVSELTKRLDAIEVGHKDHKETVAQVFQELESLKFDVKHQRPDFTRISRVLQEDLVFSSHGTGPVTRPMFSENPDSGARRSYPALDAGYALGAEVDVGPVVCVNASSGIFGRPNPLGRRHV